MAPLSLYVAPTSLPSGPHCTSGAVAVSEVSEPLKGSVKGRASTEACLHGSPMTAKLN